MKLQMIVAGAIIGALVPEYMALLSPTGKGAPWSHNVLSSVAFGIIFAFLAS
jgi:hypothetical protein